MSLLIDFSSKKTGGEGADDANDVPRGPQGK
jgi:hypothetical protein